VARGPRGTGARLLRTIVSAAARGEREGALKITVDSYRVGRASGVKAGRPAPALSEMRQRLRACESPESSFGVGPFDECGARSATAPP